MSVCSLSLTAFIPFLNWPRLATLLDIHFILRRTWCWNVWRAIVVQSSAYSGLNRKDSPPRCTTFSRSGCCQQNSICSSSFTKGWGITPVRALAEWWERLTSGAGRLEKDDEKGKKRASTCEKNMWKLCGREVLRSRSPRILIKSEFYWVKFVNVECLSSRGRQALLYVVCLRLSFKS